jgi:glycosyltransferase involved in cell wall biosynthesis
MNPPLRLVQIITGLSVGGAERMLLKVLERIDRSRFTPHVISLTTKGDIGPRIEALGVPVSALHMTAGRPSPIGLLRLVRDLRSLRPDVVHTWMYHADLVGGIAARLAGVGAIGWSLRHSDLSKDKNRRSTLWVARACGRLSPFIPRLILCCSEKARQTHLAVGYVAAKMRVIPNGFDLRQFVADPGARRSVREELALPADSPLVGLVARYDAQKNHLGFIEAASLICRSVPDVHFVLAGTGVDASNALLIAAIQKAGLVGRFFLLGQRDDIARLLAAMDVLASPSHGEAFPNVLGEAMACGVPCVVTEAGDSAEIVGGTGRVVALGDMKGLAEHIVELLRMPREERLTLGQRARERVNARYEIGQVVRLYERFYEELLEQTACAA